MDELALLRDFRLEDAPPAGARDHARALLRAAIDRQQRRRRRTFALAAFVGAAILAGAAYGVVRELIIGSPAPEEVREQSARFGHSAELIPVPHPDDPQLDQARVAAVLDSSVGPVYLFSSPNARGLCGSVWIEGDRGYQGRLNMTGVCGSANHSFYAFGNQSYHGTVLHFAAGRAADGVARIAVGFGSRMVNVPLAGRWFLAEFPEQPDQFRSYDSAGHVLEHQKFSRLAPRPPATRPPHQITRARRVARIRARGGEQVSLFVGGASDGGYCQIVRSDRRPSNFGCSVARPRARQMGVEAMNFGGAPGGILLLVGPVGREIHTLELRYQDGRAKAVPLRIHWALYEVARSDYVEGRRPELLIGRDPSGRAIASKRLPYP